METSTFQSLKLAVVSAIGLSKDALHVHVGMIVFVLVFLALRRNGWSIWPWLSVLAAAALGEAIDAIDDIRSLGAWRWAASARDVASTLFWPTCLSGLAWLSTRRRGEQTG